MHRFRSPIGHGKRSFFSPASGMHAVPEPDRSRRGVRHASAPGPVGRQLDRLLELPSQECRCARTRDYRGAAQRRYSTSRVSARIVRKGETMTTLENRPNTALARHRRADRRRKGGSRARRGRRQHRQPCREGATRTGTGRLGPALLRAACEGERRLADRPRAGSRVTPSRSSRRTTATPSRTPPSRQCCRASESGGLLSPAHRPMRASARRFTERSSEGTTRPWSAMPIRPRTTRNGERHRQTRSSPTRTCTGPTRRLQGGRPGRSRPRTSTSAARPETCATPMGTGR